MIDASELTGSVRSSELGAVIRAAFLRLFTIPATLARSARRTVLHLADKAPWAHLAVSAVTRLHALAAPT